MSHHLDSPIARQDIRLDITDLYVFRGQTGTVFAINVCHSIFGPIPAPGYHPEGMYDFKIDLNGDALEDLAYRFTFSERDAQGKQKYTVRQLIGADAADPHAAGTVVAQGTTDENVSTPSGLRVWAGKAGDPFWIEPDVLHAVGHAFQDGKTVDLAGWDQAKAKNLFAGHTVYSMVLEIPDAGLLAAANAMANSSADESENPRIGVWALSILATDAGGWRHINRVGLPMIHPLFTQFNEDLGNRLNGGAPSGDLSTFGPTVAKAVAGVVAAYGTAQDPQAYGEKVAQRFCPNVLPYQVGTSASFGFEEWNGRSLIDNAPDVMFTLAANTPIRLGIGRESVTSKPRANFPYVPAAAATDSKSSGAAAGAPAKNWSSPS
jgi:uncharacterized protein DUF4331